MYIINVKNAPTQLRMILKIKNRQECKNERQRIEKEAKTIC